MQNLLLNCLWQIRRTILGGLAHGGFSKFGLLKAVAGWQAVAGQSMGLSDRTAILPIQRFVVQGDVLPLLVSFDQLAQGIHLSTVGYAIAGYAIAGHPLDRDDLKQFSGRYRLERAVPI